MRVNTTQFKHERGHPMAQDQAKEREHEPVELTDLEGVSAGKDARKSTAPSLMPQGLTGAFLGVVGAPLG